MSCSLQAVDNLQPVSNFDAWNTGILVFIFNENKAKPVSFCDGIKKKWFARKISKGNNKFDEEVEGEITMSGKSMSDKSRVTICYVFARANKISRCCSACLTRDNTTRQMSKMILLIWETKFRSNLHCDKCLWTFLQIWRWWSIFAYLALMMRIPINWFYATFRWLWSRLGLITYIES